MVADQILIQEKFNLKNELTLLGLDQASGNATGSVFESLKKIAMRRINQLVFIVCLMLLRSTSFAQITPGGILERKEKVEYKFFDRSYDQENNRLRRVNDTLNFFVNEQKKISFTSLNIVKLKDFEGFEKDIDGFFEMLRELKLDHQNIAYSIRYRPENKEITVSERGDAKFKSVDGMVIPIDRHEVVFSYYGKMLEIRFFWGIG